METTTAYPATDKQVAFIRKLAAERLAKKADGTVSELTVEEVVAAREGGMDAWLAGLDKKAASKRIDGLLAAPKKPKAVPGGIVDSGIPGEDGTPPLATGAYVDTAKKGDVHVVDGEYLRVHIAQKSGHPYAVKAVIVEEAEWDGDTLVKSGKVQWVYAPGVIKTLSPSTFATAEEAAAFGKMVGRCCFCSTPIDTPESIAAGYGPVCAANRGLPWGDAITKVTGKVDIGEPDVLATMYAGAIESGYDAEEAE